MEKLQQVYKADDNALAGQAEIKVLNDDYYIISPILAKVLTPETLPTPRLIIKRKVSMGSHGIGPIPAIGLLPKRMRFDGHQSCNITPWDPQSDALQQYGSSDTIYDSMQHSYGPSTGFPCEENFSATAVQAFVSDSSILQHPQGYLGIAAGPLDPPSPSDQLTSQTFDTENPPLRTSQYGVARTGHGPAIPGYPLPQAPLNPAWKPILPPIPTIESCSNRVCAPDQLQLYPANWAWWGSAYHQQPPHSEFYLQRAVPEFAPYISQESSAHLYPAVAPSMPMLYPSESSCRGDECCVGSTAMLPPLLSPDGLDWMSEEDLLWVNPDIISAGSMQGLAASSGPNQSAHQQVEGQQQAEQLLRTGLQQQLALELQLQQQTASQSQQLVHPPRNQHLVPLSPMVPPFQSVKKPAKIGLPAVRTIIRREAPQRRHSASMLRLLGHASPAASTVAISVAQSTQILQQTQQAMKPRAQPANLQDSVEVMLPAPGMHIGPAKEGVRSRADKAVIAATAATHLATVVCIHWEGNLELEQAGSSRDVATPTCFPISMPRPRGDRLSTDVAPRSPPTDSIFNGAAVELHGTAQSVSHTPWLPLPPVCRPKVLSSAVTVCNATIVKECDAANSTTASSLLPSVKSSFAVVVQSGGPRGVYPYSFDSAATLCKHWMGALSLQRFESVLLAMHIWLHVRSKMTLGALQNLGASRPLEAALMVCLWVAAKMEEFRFHQPNASQVGFLVSCDCQTIKNIEVYIMSLCGWHPTQGWQKRRLVLESQLLPFL